MTGINLSIDKIFSAASVRKAPMFLGDVSQLGQPAFGLPSTLGGGRAVFSGIGVSP